MPRLRDLQLEVDLAAERGDVATVRAALERHNELGRLQLAQAVRTTTLLRTAAAAMRKDARSSSGGPTSS